MSLRSHAIALILICGPIGARASTFALVNTTFSNGATATGTINIDTLNGLFGSLNAIVKNGATTYTFNSASTGLGIGMGSGYVFTNYYDGVGDFINFELKATTLAGYTGGNICTFALCGGSGYLSTPNNVPVFTSGSLASAPEPQGFVLCLSGLVGWMVAKRRRLIMNRRPEA